MSSPVSDSTPILGLPENARRVLEPGETYVPVVSQESGVLEVTGRSVTMGLFFCFLFSMAAAYLALKVGQGIEAAIPIAILCVGMARFFPRRSTILENVIATSIGANSSHVVAGAVFTIPALYMLAGEAGSGVAAPTVWQVILVSFLGGCLGILFLIPLRYHFMIENHGVFPWPEATATTEVLVSSEGAGDSAKVLALSAGLGALYDGLVSTGHAMAENITLQVGSFGQMLRNQFMTLRGSNVAALVGIGYIVGLKYDAIICAGSFLSYLVLVPAIHAIGQYAPGVIAPGALPIAQMSPDQVFKAYVRIIGVGGIAGAGIMGILSSLPSMVSSIRSNMKGLKHQDTREMTVVPRVDRTLPGSFVLVGLAVFVLVTYLFFSFGLGLSGALGAAAIATALVMVIAFLFAPVAARAIAIIGTNPISGMTMMTLIITGVVMLKLGLTGGRGMFLTMMVGGVVCTALSASGAFATDLKIGHWIGATPAKQMGLKFLGTFVAAVGCGLAMWLLAGQPGGFGSASIPAPQASAMKTILTGIFGTASSGLQWYLFGLGVLLSLLLRMCSVPALAFALGMYLPIELNTTLLIGGLLAHFVNRARKGESDGAVKAKENRGIIVASGLMAGGALMGMADAALRYFATRNASVDHFSKSIHVLSDHSLEGVTGQWLAMGGMLALCAWILLYSRNAKTEAP